METNEHTTSNRGHETSDAHFKSVVMSGIGLLGLMAAGLAVSFALLTLFKGSTAAPGAHPETFVEPSNDLPPAPRLQADPHASLLSLKAREDSLLTSYGRIGEDLTVVRIPIKRAIEILAEKGLQ